eukprot:10771394-Lingulodinium_polyedra.AAC.1
MNRGCGPDGVPAEVLRAGGGALAVRASEAFAVVVGSEVWPACWAGGRVQEVHKGKGPLRLRD